MSFFLALALAAAPVSTELSYEDRLIEVALEAHHVEREPVPEGKRIERVIFWREDVFSSSDPYPLLLNMFHTRTRNGVVRREVLLQPGDRYDASRVQETERNLRRLFFFAVARVVPVRGAEGGVVLLVVTKDKWSLRLSNSFTLIGSLLQYLQLQLVEANFNGWGQQLAVNTTVRLDTVAVGQFFVERRLFGTRLYFGESASIIFNRQTGAPEGTSGQLTFGRPIITLDQQWGFLLDTTWNVRRRRVFRGASIWQLPYPDETSEVTVPLVYDVREVTSEASVVRSFGRALKLDVTLALGGWSRQYAPPRSSMLDDERRAWLIANYLPRSENVTYVSAFARAFPSDFKVLKNIDTFELSEDFQIGWVAQAGARWAFPLPFAPSHFVELGAALRYRFYLHDDLFTASVSAAMRVRPGEPLANQQLAAELINYSPPFWGGRFVTRLLVDLRRNDLNNRQVLLGGSTGLRGAFPEQFSGRNMVLGNFEYRARPIELWSNWLGMVLFWDAGSAFDRTPVLTHSVGLGFRLLLPQLNREVIRVDFGFVLNGAQPGADRINASWGQVTDLRPDFLDQPI